MGFMEIFASLLAVYILLAVAFPERFIPEMIGKKKKKLASTYWGVYNGVSTTPSQTEKIDAPSPSRAGGRVVAGSSMYSKGKGVSMKR
jgi:hypothetical protein